MQFKFKVEVREYERGWGSSLLEMLEFDTYDEAVAAINKENARNTAPVAPDYYTAARPYNFDLNK